MKKLMDVQARLFALAEAIGKTREFYEEAARLHEAGKDAAARKALATAERWLARQDEIKSL